MIRKDTTNATSRSQGGPGRHLSNAQLMLATYTALAFMLALLGIATVAQWLHAG